MKVHKNAGKATAEAGEVMLDGPDGVAVSMTPDAAIGTAAELDKAARVGQEQVDQTAAENSDVPPEKRSPPPQA